MSVEMAKDVARLVLTILLIVGIGFSVLWVFLRYRLSESKLIKGINENIDKVKEDKDNTLEDIKKDLDQVEKKAEEYIDKVKKSIKEDYVTKEHLKDNYLDRNVIYDKFEKLIDKISTTYVSNTILEGALDKIMVRFTALEKVINGKFDALEKEFRDYKKENRKK